MVSKSSTENVPVLSCKGGSPAFLGWKMRQMMVQSISLFAQAPAIDPD